jgi:hypothetical protein
MALRQLASSVRRTVAVQPRLAFAPLAVRGFSQGV